MLYNANTACSRCVCNCVAKIPFCRVQTRVRRNVLNVLPSVFEVYRYCVCRQIQ